MVEIWPASSDNILCEMAESSLKIDPQNANSFSALVHRLINENAEAAMALAARIPKIDPMSPYAPYLFSILIFLLYYTCTIRVYREV